MRPRARRMYMIFVILTLYRFHPTVESERSVARVQQISSLNNTQTHELFMIAEFMIAE